MTTADLIALSPLTALAVSTIVIMLIVAVQRNHALTVGLTLLADAVAFASLFVVTENALLQDGPAASMTLSSPKPTSATLPAKSPAISEAIASRLLYPIVA